MALYDVARLPLLAALCSLLAACGGGSGPSAVPVTTSTGTSGAPSSTPTNTGSTGSTGTTASNGVTTTELYTYGDGTIVDEVPDAGGVDGQNNLYVASINYKHVTRVTPAGVATTYIGNTADATVNVDIGTPLGMAVNQAGDVYVANATNIVKVTAAGQASTPFQYADVYAALPGAASDQRTQQDSQIAVDNAGNLYVIVACSGIVRKVTPSGAVSTLTNILGVESQQEVIGGGEGSINNCTAGANGIAVGADGTVYVADTLNHMILEITTAGAVVPLAGSAAVTGNGDGVGANASFTAPWHLSVDNAGNVYVSDTALIRKITPQGVVSTILGGTGSSTIAALPNSAAPKELGAFFVEPLGADSLYAISVYSTDGWGVLRFDNLPQ